MAKGWFKESRRHSLARRGVKTTTKNPSFKIHGVYERGKRTVCTGCGEWLKYKGYCERCQGEKKVYFGSHTKKPFVRVSELSPDREVVLSDGVDAVILQKEGAKRYQVTVLADAGDDKTVMHKYEFKRFADAMGFVKEITEK